jgi:hypothetical protein
MSGLTLDEIKQSARPVLVRLALVSHAPSGRMDAMPRTHGTPEHRRPPGEANPEAEVLAHRLSVSTSLVEATGIVDEIRSELAHATRRALPPDTTETAEDMAERIVSDGVGWTVDDVSRAMHCTRPFVRTARLSFGRDPETGFTPPDGDPMNVARELHAAGRSLYTVAALTGVPRSTLRYRLGLR